MTIKELELIAKEQLILHLYHKPGADTLLISSITIDGKKLKVINDN